MLNTIPPVKQALVQTLRANAALKAAVHGFHEGIAPQRTEYPYLVYDIAYAPLDYDWTGVVQRAGFDIFVYGDNSVDAGNIDQLVLDTLHDAALGVTGQTTLYCRRTGSLSSSDIDETGRRVFQVGGTYEVWTDQHLPETTQSAFLVDAVIST